MPTGRRQKALRSLGSTARALVKKYHLKQDVSVSANSSEKDILRTYKSLCLVVHPDKGGEALDFQELRTAYEAWVSSKKNEPDQTVPNAGGETPGASSASCVPGALADTDGGRAPDAAGGSVAFGEGALAVRVDEGVAQPATFRIHNFAVLLTYSLGDTSTAVWPRFLALVQSRRKQWSVRHWSATLEESDSGRRHIHLMLQFNRRVDVASTAFSFEGRKPNARPSWSDYLGEAFARKSPQRSFDRGFFYVWADKVGTVRMPCGSICVAGDYAPVWAQARKKYKVLRKWPQSLWEARKLSHDVYDELLFETRQGVIGAKRNLEAVREHELERKEMQEMVAVAARIRSSPSLLRPFLKVPLAEQWLQSFNEDRLRFPMLLVLGPSHVGKTEFAKSLFVNALELKIGQLPHFPDKMRLFQRRVFDGIILDDIRDLELLAQHQHVLQGKYDERAEFASTPGGQCAFKRWLYRVPFVATSNYSTANLEYLRTHDFLNKPETCVVLELRQAPVQPVPGSATQQDDRPTLSPAEALQTWTVADVKVFLNARDLRGLADLCSANGVNGADFAGFNLDTVGKELQLTPFQTKKLLNARDAFLAGEVGDGRSGR